MTWRGWTLLWPLALLAQGTGDLIVVSETGEPFRLYLNGEWILETPGTRAEAYDIHDGLHRGTVYIYPSEGRVIQIKKSFDVEAGYVEYYAIRKNRKGKYTISLYNRAMKEEPPVTPPPPVPSTPTQPPAPSTGQPATTGGGQVQQNTQNQSSNIVFSPTIQIQTGGGGTQISQQQSPAPGGAGGGGPQAPVYTGPTYSGPCNCQQPMSRDAFQRALSTVQSQTFDEMRMDIAKQIARSNCLLASDVKALTQAFQFEHHRLDFAKYAYDYTLDLSNYFEVTEAFDFEHTRSELMNYIRMRSARYTCQQVPVGAVVSGSMPAGPSTGTWPGLPPTQTPGMPVVPTAPMSTAPVPSGSCQPCMSAEAFASSLNAIRGTASGISRLELAKALTTSNCLSATQIREVCRVLTTDTDRLDFAKHAYRRCCDPQNYLVVSDAFASTISREELARFIQGMGGR